MSETCFNCINNNGSVCMSTVGCRFEPKVPSKELQACVDITCSVQNEKEHLDKLVDDHWKYIEGVLCSSLQYYNPTEEDEVRIKEIEFHYKSSAKHFWSHAREYHVGETL